MKINDLKEGIFKQYCIDICAKESVKKLLMKRILGFILTMRM